MRQHDVFVRVFGSVLVCLCLTSCWAAAAGAGAEAGYVVAQEDRTVGQTIDDQAIVASVKTRLLADSEVSGFDINVDSFKGVVTLTGVVESTELRQRAIEIAQGVGGVKRVNSKLFVG